MKNERYAMKRNVVVLTVVVVLFVVAMYQNFLQVDEVIVPVEEAARAGFLAPSFTLQGIDGETYTVGGSRDKALLLNVWASWCGPCKLEAPDLVELAELYHDQLDVYALNATNDDSKDQALQFVDEYGLSFPVLWDQPDSVVELYGVLGYPTSFIIDKQGVVREVIQGVLPRDELERRIKKAL